MSRLRWLLVVGGLAVITVGPFVYLLQETQRLSGEIKDRRAAEGRAEKLRRENRILKAQQRQLAESEAALVRLQLALDAVKKRLESPGKNYGEGVFNREVGEFQPSFSWIDRGGASPVDAFESSLTAAANGDVRRLATLIELGPAGRAELARWLQRLPVGVRARYSTPEELAALFLARDVPLGGIQIKAEQKRSEGEEVLVVMFQDVQGNQTQRSIIFHQTDGSWRLLLPSSVVNDYLVELQPR